ncbi:hypothetical protein ACP4OV_005364 [Aristida adscensionis]
MDKPPIPGAAGGGDGSPLQSSPGGAAPSRTTRNTECDISRMAESPRRSPGHRRALSDIVGLPDELDLGAGGGPALSDENEEELFSMFLDVDKLNSQCGPSESEASSCATAGGGGEAAPAHGAGPRARHHHHSHSMDESSSVNEDQLLGTPATEGMSPAEIKKAMSAAKLAELLIVDPKKAKRIINNRQSAARSKERKMRYIAELERKVQFMQRDATTLSTQLALLQRDTAGLTAENSELKIRLQNTEQQVHLQDALNEALRSELQRLKMATGQASFGGSPHPFGATQPVFLPTNQAIQAPFLAMQPPPPPPAAQHHPLQAQQQQQQQQAAAALGLNLKAAAPGAPPSQWQWGGDAAAAWSESSSS